MHGPPQRQHRGGRERFSALQCRPGQSDELTQICRSPAGAMFACARAALWFRVMHALEKTKVPNAVHQLVQKRKFVEGPLENGARRAKKRDRYAAGHQSISRSVPTNTPVCEPQAPSRAPSSHMHSGSDYWALAVALAAAQRAAVAVRAAMRSALPGQVEQKRDKWSPLQ